MALTDFKITNYADNIAELPDTPSSSGISATQLKAMFDGRTDKEVKNSVNGIIETLSSVNGASNVSATPVKLDGADTVQGILDELEQSKIDKTAEADYMRISAYDTDEDGVVDNAMALAGQSIEYFETKEEADNRNDEVTSHLEETDLNHNSLKTDYEAFKEATTTDLANRVEKEEGKGLSKNDLTDELKGGYDDAVALKHWHDNKPALDSIPSGGVVNTLGNDDTTIPTSKAVAEAISFAGGGDMLKATYDKNKNGIVDNAEALEGHSASYFAKREDVEKLAEDKVDKVAGKGLSTNDYTDADKEKVDNALPKSEKDNLFGVHNKDNLPSCAFKNFLNFQYNDSVVARVGGHGDSEYHNVWIDAINDSKTATRFQIRKKISDGSAEALIINQSNGTWGASSKIYGDHNLDYVKQKLGGGNCNIKTGAYTGDGTGKAGEDPRFINIGVTPKIVLIFPAQPSTENSNNNQIMNLVFVKIGITPKLTMVGTFGSSIFLTDAREYSANRFPIVENGFMVGAYDSANQSSNTYFMQSSNRANATYNYIAIY